MSDTQPDQQLKGKVIVVTGAASGIGTALARRFAAAGARVALLDIDRQGVDALAAELHTSATGVVAIRCDVTSFENCMTAVDEVRHLWGGIDILINNAGLTHLSRFGETKLHVLRRVMEVNFWGAVHCTKAAFDALVQSRGQVVVLSSIAGFAPLAGRAGYAASKHALQGLFGSLRAELRPLGVHVLIVCPGFTRTNIGRNALGADGKHTPAARTTTGRDMSPEQVAQAVYRAVVHRRRQIVLSLVGKLAQFLMHWSPALYDRIMARTLL